MNVKTVGIFSSSHDNLLSLRESKRLSEKIILHCITSRSWGKDVKVFFSKAKGVCSVSLSSCLCVQELSSL